MRIFVSHGQDKNVVPEVDFLRDLAAALAKKTALGGPHEVLYDKAILRPGALWSDVLHDVLAECQAAVLLLSPRALTRDWVLKESTVLAYRKAMDPEFPIFPVLIGGLQPSALDGKGFSPLCLGDLQGVLQTDSPQAIADAVQRELAALADAPSASPLEQLSADLGTWIAKAGNTAALEAVGEDFYGQPVQWLPGAGRARQRADVIARGIVRACEPPLPRLAPLIKRLHQSAGLEREPADVVLMLASPLWVHPDAAAQLADVAGRNRAPGPEPPPPAVSVVLDTGMPEFTPDRYVRRVLLPTTAAEVVCSVDGGGSDAWDDELPAKLRQAYRRAMSLPASFSDQRIDRRLAAIDEPLRDTGAVFFRIPPPMPDAALLDTLQRTFPRVTLLLHSGGLPPSQWPPRVVALAPPLDDAVEDAMQEDFVKARKAIRPMGR
jgi:hypothetical protein